MVYVILLIDDYSRFILGFRVLEEISVDCIIDLVCEAIQRYGKMGEILTTVDFFGILKNIQHELDDAQYQEYCREKDYYKSLLAPTSI